MLLSTNNLEYTENRLILMLIRFLIWIAYLPVPVLLKGAEFLVFYCYKQCCEGHSLWLFLFLFLIYSCGEQKIE